MKKDDKIAGQTRPHWWIYQGRRPNPDGAIDPLVLKYLDAREAPPWRHFDEKSAQERGARFQPEEHEIERVNTALLLRRPLLITGKPGTGKTTLAYSVAYDLGLGEVLRWSITSRTALEDGLYHYDAIARLQDSQQAGQEKDIGSYLKMGPLGTAFIGLEHEGKYYPKILLIDEIDKSDIDLPNDLLHIFEEGEFDIPELSRLSRQQEFFEIDLWDSGRVRIPKGHVKCRAFPLVIMTSNGEREFPPAFLRRCLQLEMQQPPKERLERIVEAHLQLEEKLNPEWRGKYEKLLEEFLARRDDKKQDLATDQLLNALYLILKEIDPEAGVQPLQDKNALLNALWKSLSGMESL
ncbi:MAG: MoxR family ATPase [Gammaproteobacteria bacterium]|nr:MoxR family ATPase [Gammaproteobacteria bacterium]